MYSFCRTGRELYNSLMSEKLPILYSFRRCPYAMRARLALRYAEIRCELREVVLRNKPAAMLAASPKGTVPVLLVPAIGEQNGAEVIEESLDIMLWSLAQHDPDGWLDVDPVDADTLITANDDDFKIWLDRYKYPDCYDDTGGQNPQQQCARFLDELERRLGRHGWLAGDRLSFVDIAVFPFVRQFAFVDIDGFRAAPYPLLNQWMTQLLEGQLFISVMQKYPAWQPGDEVVIF